jgi:hypothetical protein
MTIEIVNFPIKHGDLQYIVMYIRVYQRVYVLIVLGVTPSSS